MKTYKIYVSDGTVNGISCCSSSRNAKKHLLKHYGAYVGAYCKVYDWHENLLSWCVNDEKGNAHYVYPKKCRVSNTKEEAAK